MSKIGNKIIQLDEDDYNISYEESSLYSSYQQLLENEYKFSNNREYKIRNSSKKRIRRMLK